MRLLLDTPAFLGWIGGGRPVPRAAEQAIAGDVNECLVSHVTAWEIGIKVATGKLRFARSLEDFYLRHLAANRFRQLPIGLEHVGRFVELEPVHGDPFDRLLAAQALEEGLAVVSGDRAFDAYGVKRIW